MEPMTPLPEETAWSKFTENGITFMWVVCVVLAFYGKNWPALAACIYIVVSRICERDTNLRVRRIINNLILLINMYEDKKKL